MLAPKFSPYGAVKAAVNRMQLGSESDGFMFTRIGYQKTGEVVYQLRVRCDNAPHCNGCECDSSHYATLTEEQVTDLYRMLES